MQICTFISLSTVVADITVDACSAGDTAAGFAGCCAGGFAGCCAGGFTVCCVSDTRGTAIDVLKTADLTLLSILLPPIVSCNSYNVIFFYFLSNIIKFFLFI